MTEIEALQMDNLNLIISRGDVAEEVIRLQSALSQIHAHLGAALMQTIPSDNQIIIGHIRDAEVIAKNALK